MLRDADYNNPLRDDEWPDDNDAADDDASTDVVPCPACGAMVAEDTQQCPNCKQWITARDTDRRGIRRWVWAIAAVMVFIILMYWR